MDSLPPLGVTVIGSWARPAWYAHFLEHYARRPENYGDDDRAEILRDAVRLAIDDQVAAGADLITDGEMGRSSGFAGFCERLSGVERLAPARKLGAPSPDRHPKYLCTAPLSAPKGLGLLEEYQRLTGLTKMPVKMTVPGPYTLAEHLIGGKIYRDREAIAEALFPIVNRELRALVEAEAPLLQIDEPSFACRPETLESFLRLVQRAAAGVRAFVSLHLCFGNDQSRSYGPRTYRPLFPGLGKAAVQQLALEFASREMADVEVLSEIKPPMGVAVGLVDVKNNWVEPPELVAERLRIVLKYIPPDRVQVAPDCGFAHTPRSIACAKLESLSAGARIVRKELGL
jgi:5-methyltetrahydropteroyltriglutamate--homocysteine methyltransferase